MSQTELVLMPGEDYQQICDNLRAALDTDDEITSDVAAAMTGTLRNEIDKAIKSAKAARHNEDLMISGPAGSDYYNDRVTKIRGYAFYYVAGLDGLMEFPNVTDVGMGAFRSCTNIKQVKIPKNETLSNNVFHSCEKMEFVDIGYTVSLSSGVFNNASSLKEIVIRKNDEPAALTNVSAFNGTPFASGGTGGKIYVPAALVEDYKAATNWSVLYGYGNCEFAALEGSEYE